MCTTLNYLLINLPKNKLKWDSEPQLNFSFTSYIHSLSVGKASRLHVSGHAGHCSLPLLSKCESGGRSLQAAHFFSSSSHRHVLTTRPSCRRRCPTPSSCIPPTCWAAGGTPSTPPRPSLSAATPATAASVWAVPTATRAAWTQVGGTQQVGGPLEAPPTPDVNTGCILV